MSYLFQVIFLLSFFFTSYNGKETNSFLFISFFSTYFGRLSNYCFYIDILIFIDTYYEGLISLLVKNRKTSWVVDMAGNHIQLVLRCNAHKLVLRNGIECIIELPYNIFSFCLNDANLCKINCSSNNFWLFQVMYFQSPNSMLHKK